MPAKTPMAWTVLIAAATLGAAAVIGAASGMQDRDDAFVIDRFDQIVGVQPDGTTAVQETIDVIFVEPRRGIFRDLPDELRFDGGAYDVVSVDQGQDGVPWNWTVERWDGGPRIRIGDAAVWLDPGNYRYRLRYFAPTWSHLLADNANTVETRINVPGFDWPTTIASTRLTMVMPGPIVDVSCVQGQRGSTTPCSQAPVVDGNMLTIEFDAFDVRHAATVAVQVPADAFVASLPTYDATPLGTSGLFEPLEISRPASGLLAALMMLLPLLTLDGLYARSVYRDRVTDPQLHDRIHPTALPAPPFGFRAPEVAGLLLKRTGQPLFLSALVDFDQRGYVDIAVEGDGKKRTVTMSRSDSTAPEHASDRAVLDALLARSGTLTFGNKYNESVAKRVRAATAILERRAKHVFRDNGFKHDGGQLLRSPAFKVLAALAVIVWAVIAAAALAALTPLSGGVILAITAVTVAGWLLGHAPWAHFRLPLNSAGRDATAQARAFDEFVRTVEAEQLDWASGQPGISHLHPSVALLPYAIVLGHANSWFKRFGEIIAQFAQPSASTSTSTAGAATAWWATQGNFAAVQSAQSSTTTAPSSSGSGGGGGGSGGGGGGGGSW